MKNLKSFFSTLLILIPFLLSSQYTLIPDANFEQELITQGIDTEGTLDGQLLTADAQSIGGLNVANLSISDLSGIEDFINLTSLFCGFNNLTSLDVSSLPLLSSLNCQNNQITSLDVSVNMNLSLLYCGANGMVTLNVTNLSDVYFIECSGNNISTLDLTGLSNLQTLLCSQNNIGSLDLSSAIILEQLICSDNNLSSLDISGNNALESLEFNNNNVSMINFGSITSLQYFNGGNNLLASLDLSSLPNLTDVLLSNNVLINLNIQNGANTSINYIEAINNNLCCVAVDDPAYSTANWTAFDSNVIFDTICPALCTVLGQNCPPLLDLDPVTIISGLYKASNEIQSDNIIANPNMVIYQSDNIIGLDAGFEIPVGVEFEAAIVTCVPD